MMKEDKESMKQRSENESFFDGAPVVVPADPGQPMGMIEQAITAANTIPDIYRTVPTRPTCHQKWLLWTLVVIALVGLVVGLSLGFTVGRDNSSSDDDGLLCQEPSPLTGQAQACLDESLQLGLGSFGQVSSFQEVALSTSMTCIPEDFDPSCEGPEDYDKPYWYTETDSCSVTEPDNVQEFLEDCEAAGGTFSVADLDEPLFCRGKYWITEHVMVHHFRINDSLFCAAVLIFLAAGKSFCVWLPST